MPGLFILSNGRVRRADDQEIIDNLVSRYAKAKNKRFFLMRTVTRLNQRDRLTGHSTRVAQLSELLARCMQKRELLDMDPLDVRDIAYLHDIGKLVIPTELLHLPRRLTYYEFEVVKTHVGYGKQILETMGLPQKFVDGAHLHHLHPAPSERSYPLGVSYEKKPTHVEIITGMDTMDAIAGPRSHTLHRTWNEAIPEIRNNMGTQFNPVISEAFEDMVKMDVFKSFYEEEVTYSDLVARIDDFYA